MPVRKYRVVCTDDVVVDVEKRVVGRSSRGIRLLTVGVVASSMLGLGAAPLAAQTGCVTSARDGMPVATAQVAVRGTALGTMVDGDWRFRLTNVPAGTHELRARSIGYQPAIATFTVEADASQPTRFDIGPLDGRRRNEASRSANCRFPALPEHSIEVKRNL